MISGLSIGECGKCKSVDLDYGDLGVDYKTIYYPFHCNNCGASGKEWYSVIYEETIMDKRNQKRLNK